MLKSILQLLLTILPIGCILGQSEVRLNDVCSVQHDQLIVLMSSDEDTEDLIFEILDSVGIRSTFEIYASNDIDEIAAHYNEETKTGFLIHHPAIFKRNGDDKDWAVVTKLSLGIFGAMQFEELRDAWTCKDRFIEADRFAGHVLYKMGATIQETKSAIANASQSGAYKWTETRPERINRVEAGWEDTKAIETDLTMMAPSPEVALPPGPEVSNPKSVRLNNHLILKRTGYPILEESWNSGYQIKESVFANGQWYVVMTPKGENFLSQAMRLRAKWPEDDIKKFWDKDYDISRVDYYNNVWFLCMTSTEGEVLQRWRTRVKFPETEIEKGWNQGYYIIDMSYGDGLYALILDKKPDNYYTQTWMRRSYFPKEEINELWAKDHKITFLKYINGEYVLVMTKIGEKKEQKWFTSNTFPSDIIETHEDQGFMIRCLNYATDQWILVMEEE
ncbi:MAG: hypothetical protein AAF502_02265 [Bacteroidota bacterium]